MKHLHLIFPAILFTGFSAAFASSPVVGGRTAENRAVPSDERSGESLQSSSLTVLQFLAQKSGVTLGIADDIEDSPFHGNVEGLSFRQVLARICEANDWSESISDSGVVHISRWVTRMFEMELPAAKEPRADYIASLRQLLAPGETMTINEVPGGMSGLAHVKASPRSMKHFAEFSELANARLSEVKTIRVNVMSADNQATVWSTNVRVRGTGDPATVKMENEHVWFKRLPVDPEAGPNTVAYEKVSDWLGFRLEAIYSNGAAAITLQERALERELASANGEKVPVIASFAQSMVVRDQVSLPAFGKHGKLTVTLE